MSGSTIKEAIQHQPPDSASCVWVVFKRTLVLIVVLIAMIGSVANAAGFVGIWAARRPACDVVTALSTLVNSKLVPMVHDELRGPPM